MCWTMLAQVLLLDVGRLKEYCQPGEQCGYVRYECDPVCGGHSPGRAKTGQSARLGVEPRISVILE